MAKFVITYDVRKKYPDDYKTLYAHLNEWGAGHLQNSVWVANLNGSAVAVRDAITSHLHDEDTVCVIQLAPKPGYATQKARKEGLQVLKSFQL